MLITWQTAPAGMNLKLVCRRDEKMRKHAGLILAAMALSLGAAPVVFCGEPMAVYAATRLDAPDNTGWDDDNECIAIWDEVEGAKQCQ